MKTFVLILILSFSLSISCFAETNLNRPETTKTIFNMDFFESSISNSILTTKHDIGNSIKKDIQHSIENSLHEYDLHMNSNVLYAENLNLYDESEIIQKQENRPLLISSNN